MYYSVIVGLKITTCIPLSRNTVISGINQLA